MEYCVASGETLTEFERTVNALFLQGWEPQGGVAVITSELSDGSIGHGFYQALVRARR